MKIGLGMIVRNEEVDLPKCLITFLPNVDVACILDTGSTDNTMTVAREILESWGKPFILKKYIDASDSEGRICDFAKARNEYLRELEEFRFPDDGSYVNYIVSADADDIYISPFTLKIYIDEHPADIYMYKYWTTDKDFFLSFKMWKADPSLRYSGKVHEVLGVNWNLNILQSDIEIKHCVGHHEGQENGSDRNRRILRPEIYPPLRSLFYWANENVDIGNHKEAIKWYIEYIRRCKEGEQCWNVELAHCYWRAARWLQYIGEIDASTLVASELVKLDPSWSEAWCQLAYNARCKEDWESMRGYALKALENKFTPRLFSEPDKYSTTPAQMLEYLKAKDEYDQMVQANK